MIAGEGEAIFRMRCNWRDAARRSAKTSRQNQKKIRRNRLKVSCLILLLMSVRAPQTSTSQHGIAHAITEQDQKPIQLRTPPTKLQYSGASSEYFQ